MQMHAVFFLFCFFFIFIKGYTRVRAVFHWSCRLRIQTSLDLIRTGKSPNMLKFTIKLLLARSNNYVLTGVLCKTCNCHCFWRSAFIYLHLDLSSLKASERQSGWKASVWSSSVLILFSCSIFSHADLLPVQKKKRLVTKNPRMKTFVCNRNATFSFS